MTTDNMVWDMVFFDFLALLEFHRRRGRLLFGLRLQKALIPRNVLTTASIVSWLILRDEEHDSRRIDLSRPFGPGLHWRFSTFD